MSAMADEEIKRMPNRPNEDTSTQRRQDTSRRPGASRILLIVISLAVAAAALIIVFFWWPRADRGSVMPGPGARHDERAEMLSVIRVKGSRAEHDFGYVEPESKHSVIFAVENQSKDPVRIRRVRSECKCINVPDPPDVLAAAQTTNVRVDLEAPKEPASYTETVVLETEDPKNPMIVLAIKARVGLPLEVRPAVVNLGRLILGEHRYGSVTIVNDGREVLHPVYATSSDASAIACIPRASVPPAGQLVIPVLARASAAEQTPHKAMIQIHTDSHSQPQLTVEVEYTTSLDFKISQGSIELGRLGTGEKREVTFDIATTRPNPGSFVKGCSVQAARNAAVTPRVSYDGQKAVINCSVDAGRDTGAIEGAIILELDGHERPVEVRVTGFVAGPEKTAAKTQS